MFQRPRSLFLLFHLIGLLAAPVRVFAQDGHETGLGLPLDSEELPVAGPQHDETVTDVTLAAPVETPAQVEESGTEAPQAQEELQGTDPQHDQVVTDAARAVRAEALAQGGEPGLETLLAREESQGMDPQYNQKLVDVALAAGDCEQALIALERLTLIDPSNAGAWLDMALCQTRLGQREEAAAALDHIEHHFPIPAEVAPVIQRIRTQLARPAASPRLAVQASLLAGYDSNVNGGLSVSRVSLTGSSGTTQLLVDSRYRKQSAPVTLASLAAEVRYPTATGGISLQGNWVEKYYVGMEDFNSRELGVAAAFDTTLDARQITLLAEWRRLMLRRSGTVDIPKLGAGYQTSCLFGHARCGLEVETEWRLYSGDLSDYEGRITWLGFNIAHQYGSGTLTGSARLGADHPLNQRTGGRIRRQEWSLEWNQPIPWHDAQLQVKAAVATTRDADGFSPVLENNAARQTQQYLLHAEYTWPLAGKWRGVVSADISRQHSNIEIFSVNQEQIYAGLRYRF